MKQDEEARLDALYQLNLLDTPPSASFDRITRMASQIFNLPISAVSLTDRDRQWFKSRVGVEHSSIPRDKAPCAQVAETTEVLVIPAFSPTTAMRRASWRKQEFASTLAFGSLPAKDSASARFVCSARSRERCLRWR
ncbi:hypothetical protein [Sphingomonas solaris]|uniref:hypothetical protein n=1 Tax=Sphingomonadales TaxID=204457 RepID=UPI001EEFB97E|nr:hypothetical protein [Sphingomonas solaris]